jgi:uncharacterized protein YcaQ
VRAGTRLSGADARRLVVAAQGLARARPNRSTTARGLRGVVATLNVLQLDAINVLERTQFLVPFSRIGGYDVGRLHAMSGPGGELYETWAHAASLVPMEQEPLFRWRQAIGGMYDESPTHARRSAEFRAEHADYIASLVAEISERGALAASQLSDPRRGTGDWWERRGLGRRALELLFGRGELAAWRTPSFERVYDLPDRVIPDHVRSRPTPTVEEAHRALVLIAARAYGVATASDLAGYHMLKPRATRPRVDELVEDGALLPVQVDGWTEPGYVPADAKPGRATRTGATLVSPFDSLVWDRKRTLRVFGFDYRIEVYVPAPQRRHGYYVLPLLVGDQLVARLDLKADRKASTLRVAGAFVEPGRDASAIAPHAAAELHALRAWLHLEALAIGSRGNLARALASAVREDRATASE